ncbi:hypothetical protein A6A27_16195 [Micromonospora sp. CB01531]|nr:hypothetical protein A6A27_16195 [Micromonospora sp. CB01531]
MPGVPHDQAHRRQDLRVRQELVHLDVGRWTELVGRDAVADGQHRLHRKVRDGLQDRLQHRLLPHVVDRTEATQFDYESSLIIDWSVWNVFGSPMLRSVSVFIRDASRLGWLGSVPVTWVDREGRFSGSVSRH